MVSKKKNLLHKTKHGHLPVVSVSFTISSCMCCTYMVHNSHWYIHVHTVYLTRISARLLNTFGKHLLRKHISYMFTSLFKHSSLIHLCSAMVIYCYLEANVFQGSLNEPPTARLQPLSSMFFSNGCCPLKLTFEIDRVH